MTNERMTKMIGLLAGMMIASSAHGQVIGIEDVVLPGAGYLQTMPFVSQSASFNNNYNSLFDSWGGFAASNRTDVTTPGYLNQYSAYHLPGGGGDNSAQFAVGYWEAFTPTIPTIVLPAGTRTASVKLTNTTYVALDMMTGTPGVSKKFGGTTGDDPDYFFVTITGRSSINGSVTGSLDFYLADFRFANNSLDYIVNQWTQVDLTDLGGASVIDFTFTSSDIGLFGINTPTYVALDNLVVTPVPEPCSWWLCLVAIGMRRISRLRVW